MALSNTNEPAGNDRATDRHATERQIGSTTFGGAKIGVAHTATLDAVADALSRLRYGAVHLTVHDGKVVQLDVTERQRFT